MRILILNRGIFPIPRQSSGGGAEQHAYLLAKALGGDHDVYFVSRLSRRIRMGRRVRVIPIVLNRTYIPLNTGFLGWVLKHLFGNLLVAYIAIQTLIENGHGFDVIHAHGNLSALIISFFKRGVPLTYTVHDSTPWVGHYRSRFERVIRKLAFMCVELLAWRRADYIIAVDKGIKHELVRWGIPKHKSSVIPSGVDANPTSAVKKRYGLFVGRIEARKGIEYLLRALVGLNANFVIVGDGSDIAQYIRLAKDLQLSHVRFTGYVNKTTLEELFARASYFVLPSTSEGGTPLAVLEALSYGLPVIASRVGGLGELIVDGVSGFLVYPGDVITLREKIKLLANDPELCRQLGRNAWHLIKQKHSMHTIAGEVEQAYRMLAPLRSNGK